MYRVKSFLLVQGCPTDHDQHCGLVSRNGEPLAARPDPAASCRQSGRSAQEAAQVDEKTMWSKLRIWREVSRPEVLGTLQMRAAEKLRHLPPPPPPPPRAPPSPSIIKQY